jgi:hypothetical protein
MDILAERLNELDFCFLEIAVANQCRCIHIEIT